MIEAIFVNDSLMDGVVKYYNLNDLLLGKETFSNGLKNGIAVSYFPDGSIKDSFKYINDLLHGIRFSFDQNHSLSYIQNFYCGRPIGDAIKYIDNQQSIYQFSNFEGSLLLECKYDSIGQPIVLSNKNLAFVGSQILDDSISLIKLFIYFPKPIGFTSKYKFGIIQDSKVKTEILLNSNRLFLDTSLVHLKDTSQTYFIQVDYTNKSTDSTITVFSKYFKN